MPSVLAEEPSPIFSTDLHFLDLTFDGNFEPSLHSHDTAKVNGGPIPRKHHQPTAHRVNGSFDQSSTSSARVSEPSDFSPAHLNANGEGARPTSMSSLPNGISSGSGVIPPAKQEDGFAVGDFPSDAVVSRSDVVGSAASTLGATDHQPAEPAPPAENQQGAGSEREGVPPNLSSASLRRQSLYESFPEISPKGSADDANAYNSSPPGLTTIHSGSMISNFTAPPSASLSPDFTPRRSPYTHRFSSPPTYQAVSPTPAVSPTTGPPSAHGSLRQRHTLEVPKMLPVRTSRDGGTDSAFASGRFSPTAAGGRRSSLNLGRRATRSMHSDVPRDEIVPDEDAMRWAEAYRQKMASKRRRREEEDDDKVLVGVKVDEHHANWVTAYNMLTGIRVSVSRTNAKLDRPLTEADFHAKQKSTFDIAGNELVPSAKYDFKFKDYAPWVFRHLRSHFHLDPADYLMSLTGKYILSELGSPGKSGSFFYFSRDYKYIIKTIHRSEHKFLRKILKKYYKHVTENPNTLLSQFYGLHRVKIPYGKKIHFVVMNNLFPPHRDIHQAFDLKGSTVGREFREKDLAENRRPTLKDLNWLRRRRHIELGLRKKRMFLEQLQRDVGLLKSLHIMDYSMLIGIHDLRRGNEENLRDKMLQVFNPGGDERHSEEDHSSVLLRTPSKLESVRKTKELRQIIRLERPIPMGQTSSRMPDQWAGQENASIFCQDEGGFRATHEDDSPADELYYLGVIDCLTHYGFIKKIEHFWKGLTNDSSQISALPPESYGNRFFHFIEGITLSEEAAREEYERELAAQALGEKDGGRRGSMGRRRSAVIFPPMPNYPAPAPPQPSQQQLLQQDSIHGRPPEAKATLDRAVEETRRTDLDGTREEQAVPHVMHTTVTAPVTAPTPHSDKRHTAHPTQLDLILPVVEEAGEASSTGTSGRDPDPEDEAVPEPPPKTPSRSTTAATGYLQHLKPEGSADSGYAAAFSPGSVNGGGSRSRDSSPHLHLARARISRESLNKELPPIPSPES